MDFEDMKQYFGRVQICKYTNGHAYSFAKCEGNYHLHRLHVTQEGEHTFSISQKGERMFPRNSGYDYSPCRLWLVKLSGSGLFDGVEYIKGMKDPRERDTYLECGNLTEGESFLVSEVDWLSSTEDQSYCVTCYGASGVVFNSEGDNYSNIEVLMETCKGMVA
jgi:hypothetical protein